MIATQTTGEAFALLEATRSDFIEQARAIADELIALYGETCARAVLEEMQKRGLVSPIIKDYWMGCVFRGPRFAWTGRWVLPPVPEKHKDRNVHAWRPQKIWRKADLS